MDYKLPILKHELYLLTPMLAKMLLLAESYYPGQVVTQIVRTKKEQDNIYLNHPDSDVRSRYAANPWPSVHQLSQDENGQYQVRGVDLRYNDNTRAIEHLINQTFKYDPERQQLQCAVVHGDGDNLHLHLQSHPRTRMI